MTCQAYQWSRPQKPRISLSAAIRAVSHRLSGSPPRQRTTASERWRTGSPSLRRRGSHRATRGSGSPRSAAPDATPTRMAQHHRHPKSNGIGADDPGVVSPVPRGAVGDADERSGYRPAECSARHPAGGRSAKRGGGLMMLLLCAPLQRTRTGHHRRRRRPVVLRRSSHPCGRRPGKVSTAPPAAAFPHGQRSPRDPLVWAKRPRCYSMRCAVRDLGAPTHRSEYRRCAGDC